jgi:hypothetical protein
MASYNYKYILLCTDLSRMMDRRSVILINFSRIPINHTVSSNHTVSTVCHFRLLRSLSRRHRFVPSSTAYQPSLLHNHKYLLWLFSNRSMNVSYNLCGLCCCTRRKDCWRNTWKEHVFVMVSFIDLMENNITEPCDIQQWSNQPSQPTNTNQTKPTCPNQQ